jgi:phospholipid/cholesterol/gamma-HCH transport system substrate-binding protein
MRPAKQPRLVERESAASLSHRREVARPHYFNADPASAVAAFNDAFASIATELITWTANAMPLLDERSKRNLEN